MGLSPESDNDMIESEGALEDTEIYPVFSKS
jgi:hypothetical protein